jgi:hypothetical protein
MLVSFGCAWPASIYKSYKSRENAGKSLGFLLIIFFGYICGMAHKILYNLDGVIWLYIINGSLVLLDIGLYGRNARGKRGAAKG